MSGSIYMERKDTLFLNYKSYRFSKTIFIIVLNTYHLLLLTIHKIYLLLNFLGKESTIESLYPTSSVSLQR